MKVTDTHVYFWGGPFSNFYNCEIDYENKLFHSSEQIFMYLKAKHFKDYVTADKILFATNPKDAKALGRLVANFDNEEWDNVKTKYMKKALVSKFTQNEGLSNLLKSHSDKIFVEASPYDKIWGVGLTEYDPLILDESNWLGKNLLGKCLNDTCNDI